MKWLIRITSLGGIWVYFLTYKYVFCYYYSAESDTNDVVCIKYWKFCLFFCISYSIILLFRGGKMGVKNIIKSFFRTLLLYISSWAEIIDTNSIKLDTVL